MRRTSSATSSDPHATTSADCSGDRSPARSSHPPQPGRRTPHCSACHTSGRGDERPPTAHRARAPVACPRCGTARAVATRTRRRGRATDLRCRRGTRGPAPIRARPSPRSSRRRGAAVAMTRPAVAVTVDARRRSSSGGSRPSGVTIQTSPSSRRRRARPARRAHPCGDRTPADRP